MKTKLLSFLLLVLCGTVLFAGAATEEPAGGSGLVYWTDNASLTGDEEIYSIIEEEAGVTLLVTGVPENDYATKLQLAAAADEMPDVMARIIDSSVPVLGEQGLLLPLRDITRDKAPNMWTAVNDRGLDTAALSGLFGDGTGEFWMTPKFAYNGTDNTPSFRKDWFDETGLPIPTDPEELLVLLAAVKENHPDSIPLYVRAEDWASSLVGRWFGVYAETPMGEVEAASDAYRNALSFLATLYEYDLIDAEWPTASEESLKQAYNAGEVFMEWGFGAFWVGRLDSFLAGKGITVADYQAAQQSFPAAREFVDEYNDVMVLLPWFSNARNGEVVVQSRTRGGFEDSAMSFSADVDVDPAMALVNWLFQPDGSAHYTARYGKKGVAWNFDADGFARPTDQRDPDWTVDEGFLMMADIERLASIPHYITFQQMDAELGDKALLETRDVIAFANARDSQRRNDLEAQIDPIIQEWRLKFATGQIDVADGWDDYIAALEAAGLSELERLQTENLVPGVPHLQPVPAR